MRDQTKKNYVLFLQSVLGASNRNVKVVPDQLHKAHKVSSYAYGALKDLGYIEVKDNVTRGPQVPIWKLKDHPTERHAVEVCNRISEMQKECETQKKHALEEKLLNDMMDKTVKISVNGMKLTIPVVDNRIEFTVDGDKVEIVLED